MASYLGLITWIQYTGSRLRNPTGILVGDRAEGVRSWDIPALSRECIAGATRRGLSQRIQSLANRLLVSANGEGLPTEMLQPRMQELTELDWRGQFETAHCMSRSAPWSRGWTHPTGTKRFFRGTLVLLANYLPQLTFVASILILLWKTFMVNDYHITLTSVLIPFILTLFVLILLHMAIRAFLPLRWPAIRSDFRRHLRYEVGDRLKDAFVPVPENVAAEVAAERGAIDHMAERVAELRAFLLSRRQATGVDAMYGHKSQMVR